MTSIKKAINQPIISIRKISKNFGNFQALKDVSLDVELAEKVVNAGSVFVGEFTPESAGDYASGTNHTLPTNGWAKSFSGVSLDSFVKKITYQRITEEGLMLLGPTVERMAEAEMLDAHKNAVTVRLNKLREDGISGKFGKKSLEDGESLLFSKG